MGVAQQISIYEHALVSLQFLGRLFYKVFTFSPPPNNLVTIRQRNILNNHRSAEHGDFTCTLQLGSTCISTTSDARQGKSSVLDEVKILQLESESTCTIT